MVQTRTQSRLDFGSAGNWNAIESRAREFVDRWDDATYEKGQSQPFWIDFLGVFGIDHKRAGAYFEYPQLKLNDKQGFIDLFWPGKLVAEQKSAGRNLARARRPVYLAYGVGSYSCFTRWAVIYPAILLIWSGCG